MPWTVKQLVESSKQVSKSRGGNYSSSKTRSVTAVIPYEATKSVLFQFESQGITVQALHHVNLFFSGLEVTTEVRNNETHVSFKYRGKKFFVEKPDLYKTSVRVRCTCPDFYFTFAWWNWNNGALFGPRPREYIRKGRGAPRNPGHHPGFCKHCHNVLLLMQTKSWTGRKR